MSGKLGDALIAYRQREGISQSTAAGILGISRNYLSQIERGNAVNVSHALALRILNLYSAPCHSWVEVTLPRRVRVDAVIAPEIVWLNTVGVVTEASCQGPPPTALIRPSSADLAISLGYLPLEHQSGYFEIELKTLV